MQLDLFPRSPLEQILLEQAVEKRRNQIRYFVQRRLKRAQTSFGS